MVGQPPTSCVSALNSQVEAAIAPGPWQLLVGERFHDSHGLGVEQLEMWLVASQKKVWLDPSIYWIYSGS